MYYGLFILPFIPANPPGPLAAIQPQTPKLIRPLLLAGNIFCSIYWVFLDRHKDNRPSTEETNTFSPEKNCLAEIIV